jgi:putative ABC transport system permease protein
MRVRLNHQRLLAFVAQSRLSQNHWALKIGLSRGHWSDIVNGKHPYPSPKTRDRMVEVLGLKFEDLFDVDAGTSSEDDLDFRRAIADRYLIDSEIGQGGMGAVYLARDTRHGRTVAVKVISPEAVSGIGINQFLREISTVAQLQHPNILPLFDSGEVAGHPFYVMPYIRGGSLRARLKASIRLPASEALAIATGVAAALQSAHEQRVLHCDVKPENILLDGNHPYVMDFGVARKLHTEVLPWTLSKELDLSAGTPAYVSPEQASGEKDLDTRSDIYSLACVVYEMLSGRTPFEGTTTQQVVSRRFAAPPEPLRDFAPEVPPLLESAVERGMSLEPRRRPAKATDFSADLVAASQQASGPIGKLGVSVTRGTTWLKRLVPGLTTRIGSIGMESIMQDLRHAWRGLRNSPAFAAVVVATLALGIGANTAIFSVVRGVLLKPLPNRNGDKLVYLRHSSDQSPNLNFSVPEVRDFRTGVPSLSQVAEWSPFSVILRTDDQVMRLRTGLVTGNYFEVMGLAPILGRVTRPSDDGEGVAPVIILTYDTWRRRFSGDSSVIGKIVIAGAAKAEIIGVLEPAPFFPDKMDILMNMVISSHHTGSYMQQDRSHRMTEVVARMAPNATFEKTETEVASVYDRLKNEFPTAYGVGYHFRTSVVPFKKAMGEQAQLTLLLLMGSAAFVLIIAVANVANLTLMRRVRREQELVVRAALGAGVGRLRRLVLTENLMLSLAGAALGTLIAVGGVPLLVSLIGRYSNRADEVSLDSTVLGFTLLVAIGTALFLSFAASVPAEKELATVSSGGRRGSGSLKKQRLQRALVVVQVAVSVVLLAGAGLLTRTLLRVTDVKTGLETEELLTMNVSSILSPSERSEPLAQEKAVARFASIRNEVGGLPGVMAVATGAIPLQDGFSGVDILIEGRTVGANEAAPRVVFRFGSPGYFRAAGIPLLRGRTFEEADNDTTRRVTVINQAMADKLFPGEDPIGKRVAQTTRIAQFATRTPNWLTIVGIVGNTADDSLYRAPRPAMFFTAFQNQGGSLIVRAQSGAALLANPVKEIVARLAPASLVEQVRTLTDIKAELVAPRKLNAMLISSFSLLAVLIAAVGIAGVLAFSVSARMKEIGIRMSLGADPQRVQRMIIGEGGVLVVIGLVVGLVSAIVASQAIRGLLVGISPNDPTTFIAVVALMGTIGVVACWIPALRAARVDPAITMRSE